MKQSSGNQAVFSEVHGESIQLRNGVIEGNFYWSQNHSSELKKSISRASRTFRWVSHFILVGIHGLWSGFAESGMNQIIFLWFYMWFKFYLQKHIYRLFSWKALSKFREIYSNAIMQRCLLLSSLWSMKFKVIMTVNLFFYCISSFWRNNLQVKRHGFLRAQLFDIW